jgi:hypothetical protein
MQARIGYLSLVIALVAATAAAQAPSKTPTTTDMYCSGIVTTERVPSDIYIISGEQSNSQVVFSQGDLVYLNKGSSQDVKVGDEFWVTRAVHEPLRFPWFVGQPGLLRAMGQTYLDVGRLRVVHTVSSVSTAVIIFSCDYLRRGDLAQPFAERPAPPFRAEAKFDPFAPPSGKDKAMVVAMKTFAQAAGTSSVVYINLGSAQGVKVGDYFRVFRYQGTRHETVYQPAGMAHSVYGFGSARRAYKWDELPREILGEGIVLRVSPNAATVLLTISRREIYTGDYAELE